MATADAAAAAAEKKPASMKMVVAASSAGTAFEWYDFFLFVPLAAIMSRTFFSNLPENTAYIFALGAFAVGFAFRPIGALIFGRIGDTIGRKATFLVTMALMGVSTFAIGLLPTQAQVGIAAPLMFVGLRILQGLALGGEWGGAAIYIVEHVDKDKRGVSAAWLGSSAAFGLGGAIVVVLITRAIVGQEALEAWAWRVPFLLSAILLGISIWIRLKLHESPVFAKMREEGTRSPHPYKDAFGDPKNLKRVIICLLGVMFAQGAIWYTTFFFASTFLESTVKVAPGAKDAIMLALVALSVPLYLFFGRLSDRIGRKPVMLAGIALFLVVLFPGFHMVTRAANPALAEATARAPVVVIADPADCSLQFDPVGKSQFTTSCDIAKSVLAAAGVSYQNQAAPAGATAEVKIGDVSVRSASGSGLDLQALTAMRGEVGTRVKAALTAAGYPERADPERTNTWLVFAILMVFNVAACALYGPQAAALVEMFPAKIRYTAMSLPYHIGTGWVGGFLPATAFAIVTTTGDIYAGLWYPFVFALISLVVMAVYVKETRGVSLA